jgi:hypothetical protein
MAVRGTSVLHTFVTICLYNMLVRNFLTKCFCELSASLGHKTATKNTNNVIFIAMVYLHRMTYPDILTLLSLILCDLLEYSFVTDAMMLSTSYDVRKL